MSDEGHRLLRQSAATTGARPEGAIERTFSPEFRNRLDAWIAFEPARYRSRSSASSTSSSPRPVAAGGRKVRIDVRGGAHLARRARIRPLFGARPMRRLIQSKIKEPLAEEILFGRLKDGGTVRVDVRDGDLMLEYS